MNRVSKKYKTILSWSGGKDSAITLQRLLKNEKYSVERLLVSMNASVSRVSMHGVRIELVEKQSEVLGIPVTFLNLPENPSMEAYDSILKDTMVNLMDEGFTHCAFGDIFLEDLREFREKQLHRIGMEALFPIWGEDTTQLAQKFIDDGFKAVFACVDKNLSVAKFSGKLYSNEFLDELPDNIDPCGENGEFHTYVFDGPIFPKPIPFKKGEIVDKKYPSPQGDSEEVFQFCDLIGI